MFPAILELQFVLESRSIEGWKMLYAMNSQHPNFRLIKEKQRDVKEMWFKRPRFPKERGRVDKQGY